MGRTTIFMMLLIIMVSGQGCATLMGGQKTEHQAHKPDCDEPRRRVRPGFLIIDLICPPFLLIDFATRKIYRPYPNKDKVKHCKQLTGGTDSSSWKPVNKSPVIYIAEETSID